MSGVVDGTGWRVCTEYYREQIVDSIMACFRVDYCGRGELSE